jgi:hypothetical protein
MMDRGQKPSEISSYKNRTKKKGEEMPYPVFLHQQTSPIVQFKN